VNPNIPIRPLLRWHGGKWRLSPWIISHFPPHRVYVEPFSGAASVLLHKKPTSIEVLNDRHQRLINLFRLLRDANQARRLLEQIRLTPYAEAEYHACRESADPDNSLEDARRFLVLGWQGHGSTAASGSGRRLTGWRRGDRGGLANDAREWATLWMHIMAWSDRLRGVFIECSDALEVICRWDGPDTLIYCDPPYPLATRTPGNNGYRHDYSDTDHAALAQILHAAKGKVVISGYSCPLYKSLYAHWHLVEKRTLADARAWRTEALWLNPAAANQLRQSTFCWEKVA
jgi:DNA adenine methylase